MHIVAKPYNSTICLYLNQDSGKHNRQENSFILFFSDKIAFYSDKIYNFANDITG